MTFPISVEQGISVATLIDYYDLDLTMGSFNYPGMHGSYGNTFASEEEEEINNPSEKGCCATVCNKNGNKKVCSEIWSTQKPMERMKQEKREEAEQVFHQCCRHFCTNLSDDL